MGVKLEERVKLAHARYDAAVAAARESPTPLAWARLRRTAINLRDALAALERRSANNPRTPARAR
jgi:hypothetical protein